MSIPEIKEASNLKNNMGYTAHDILQRVPQDFKCLEIQFILMNSSIRSENNGEMNTAQEALTTTSNVVADQQEVRPRKKKSWRNILNRMGKWFKYNNGGDWLEDMRGNLSLVATVISTITFQAVLNPPGNVIQQGILDSSNNTINNQDNNFSSFKELGPLGCLPLKIYHGNNVVSEACPGEAMLASRHPLGFQSFIICNNISFVVSLCVALLLVSGIPLKNKVVMWMLSIAMCTALTFLAIAYFNALFLISPYSPWLASTDLASNIALFTWSGLLALICVYIITLFVMWLVKITKQSMRGTETETSPTA